MKKYDYTFIGTGCAGLSLLARMIAAGLTAGKNILLIDRAPKQTNDRTWCFWENRPGFFDHLVYQQWERVWFHSTGFTQCFDINPYRYKMIRGIDFYQDCLNSIRQQPAIDIVYGEISDCSFSDPVLQLKLNGQPQSFATATVFNSLWTEAAVKQQAAVYLLQHFKGWIIETPEPFFKTGEAVLMDFRTDQTNGTTFVYVLPLTATKALVEYTLFSEKLLPDSAYNNGLVTYIKDVLQLAQYTVTEEEFGVIPMTNAVFPWYANGMYHIGTAGGQTKASSGYTFQFIQKQSAAIVQQLLRTALHPGQQPAAVSKRFDFYDAVLLRVLAGKDATGSEVFTSLFSNNNPLSIFRFLDNESSFTTELRIIQSLPTGPFLKAAFRQLTGARS